MSNDYARLVAKVDALSAGIGATAASELACRAGCASCCMVELGVVAVEADRIREALAHLPAEARAAIRERADAPEGRCVMLDDDDRCAIHPARPLVCRTQGLPLLYPEGFVPEEAVLARTQRGAVTVCPLNFRTRRPEPSEIVDAERLDVMLGLIDRLEAERSGEPAGRRFRLRDLARQG